MPTDAENLARLEQLARFRETVAAWGDDLSPDDLNAIRWALTRIKRYETALEDLRKTAYHTYATEPAAICRGCRAERIIDDALAPYREPTPAETPCPTCGGTRVLKGSWTGDPRQWQLDRPCPDCAGGEKE